MYLLSPFKISLLNRKQLKSVLNVNFKITVPFYERRLTGFIFKFLILID